MVLKERQQWRQQLSHERPYSITTHLRKFTDSGQSACGDRGICSKDVWLQRL
jgi:hypothetical protein